MNHRHIQKAERVRASPPAGSVGRISAVRHPAVRLVFVQTVELPHVLGIPHRFERAHIFAAGENVRALHIRVYSERAAGNELVLIQLAFRKPRGQRLDKVAPYERLVHYLRRLAHGYFGQVDYVKPLFQKAFAFSFDHFIRIKKMQRVIVFVFRIYPVSGKASAQSVAPLVHCGDGRYNGSAVAHPAVAVDKSAYRAARRNAHVAFKKPLFHLLSFRRKRKRRP